MLPHLLLLMMMDWFYIDISECCSRQHWETSIYDPGVHRSLCVSVSELRDIVLESVVITGVRGCVENVCRKKEMIWAAVRSDSGNNHSGYRESSSQSRWELFQFSPCMINNATGRVRHHLRRLTRTRCWLFRASRYNATEWRSDATRAITHTHELHNTLMRSTHQHKRANHTNI